MMDWQRKRLPEDVPTPVAVAVSDFCRRARAPASPGLVRDALALLTEADDDKVRALADSEPTAKLGPFAVVDVVLGTQADVAAEREQSGYYETIRRKAQAHAERSPPPEVPVLTAAPSRRPEPLIQPSAPRPRKPKEQTLKERVAPVKRKAGEAKVETRLPQALPGTAFLPKRNLPAGRGRFTTVDPSRAAFETLFRPDGKDVVVALLEQVPHRVALLRTLEQGYSSKKGPLTIGDVEDVLEEHALFDAIEAKERAGLLTALVDQKGSISRASQAFGLNPEELEKLIFALGIGGEVDQVRERFSREALAADNLSLRLELLFRDRYLEDLGIEKRFRQSLEQQLQGLVDEVKDAATSAATLVDLISRQHAIHQESLRRALDKLGLLKPWTKDKR